MKIIGTVTGPLKKYVGKSSYKPSNELYIDLFEILLSRQGGPCIPDERRNWLPYNPPGMITEATASINISPADQAYLWEWLHRVRCDQ